MGPVRGSRTQIQDPDPGPRIQDPDPRIQVSDPRISDLSILLDIFQSNGRMSLIFYIIHQISLNLASD